jgi:rhodanese-related sulfurtransferase/DNA-binding transcriptional ArsR family regulator
VATDTGSRAAKDALFDGFATIAAALGSGRRAEIIEVLAQGERTVEQIAEAIDQSLANTSHHLRTLARAGLVTSRRQGTYAHYRLSSDKVADVWLELRELAAERLDDLERLASNYLGDRDQLEPISRHELLERLDTGEVVLIDVRPEAEYTAAHLPGALSVPPDQLDARLGELPEDREIVAYCRGPFCVYADDAARRLTQRGHRARRLDEGIPEWRRAGGPIETGPPDDT